MCGCIAGDRVRVKDNITNGVKTGTVSYSSIRRNATTQVHEFEITMDDGSTLFTDLLYDLKGNPHVDNPFDIDKVDEKVTA